MDTFKISEKDNVCVNLETGHKIADRDIVKGEDVVKYGFPIGVATSDIKKGEQVHTNNMKTKLEGVLKYDYAPDFSELLPTEPLQISAFVRSNGDIGIRNDIWIIPTVGCVNGIGNALSQKTGAVSYRAVY